MVIGGFAWYQDKVWKKEEKDSLAVQNMAQSARPEDAPGGNSGTKPDTKPASPVQRSRPPYENPTPEYIATVLGDAPSSSRKVVAEQFVGTPVSWDGRLFAIRATDDKPSITLRSGLSERVFGPLFRVWVKLPEDKFLLQLPTRSPLHIDGTITAIDYDTAELTVTSATSLPEPGPFSANNLLIVAVTLLGLIIIYAIAYSAK